MPHLQILMAAFAIKTLVLADSSYIGGFALSTLGGDGVVNSCPAGTLTCSNRIYTFCCPNFTFCGPYQIGSYCCPTEDDCGDTVNAALVCANPSWTLYESAFDWCCTPDQVGIALSDGECKPKGGAYSYYASTVTQLNAISPPSSWIGGVPSGLSNSMSAGAEATTNNPSATSPTQITGSTLSVVTTSQKATATTKSSSGAVIRPAFSIAVSGVALGGVFMVVALL